MSIVGRAAPSDASTVVRRLACSLIVATTPSLVAAACDPFHDDTVLPVLEAGPGPAAPDGGDASSDAPVVLDGDASRKALACRDLAPRSFASQTACDAERQSSVTPCDAADAGEPTTGDACAEPRRRCRCVPGSSGWDLEVRACECR